ncbi:MAG: tetratricopeptide repeat-containing sensor histidine kinase [Sediminibacterium sp.]|jgi:signal transduction histidine kinase|nr:tetratricopeptide repeat-containing sensor histidine kinase [Sediminibacterium sp.]
MKFYSHFIWLFAMMMTSLFAQQTSQQKIDSLEKWLKHQPKQDTVYINVLLELERFYRTYQPNKIASLTPQIISLSKRVSYQRGIYHGNNIVAYQYIMKGDVKNAMQLLMQQVSQDKYPVEKIRTLSLLAYCHLQLKLPNKDALDYMLQAEKIFQKLPSNIPYYYDTQMALLTNTAMVYSEGGQSRKAIEYERKALKILETKFNPDDENTKIQTITLMLNLGITHLELSQIKEAVHFLKRGLDYGGIHKIGASYSGYRIKLAEAYTRINKHQEALSVLNELSQNIKNQEVAQQALYYSQLAQTLAHLGDYKQAYITQQQYEKAEKMLTDNSQRDRVSELTAQYQTEKKTQQIKLLEAKNQLSETQKRQYQYAFVGAIVVLLLSLLAIYQIRKARKKAEEATLLREKMFAIVAHDLRSPVSMLQQITATIRHVLAKNNPQATQILTERIENAAISLYKLVDNLLNWALIQQGQPLLRPVKFVVSYEVFEVIKTLHIKAEMKNIEITLNDPSLVEAYADRVSVQTIIRNLVDNAIKFTPKGGKIAIQVLSNARQVEVLVSDSGGGIPQEVQADVFERDIHQGNKVGTEGESGLGVGLYICKALAKLNQGDLVLLQSSPNGTVFKLVLPIGHS